MGSRRSSRSGSLFLWLVLLGFLMLVVWGISNANLTSAARVDTVSIVLGEQAQVLADSAVAELEARFGAAVNDPASPLYASMRKLKDEPDLAPMLSVGLVTDLLKEPHLIGCSLSGTACRVQFQKIIDGVPYERLALVTFAATVQAKGQGRTAVRTVELARWVRIELVTAPRPFGDYGIFIGDASNVSDADRANTQRTKLGDRARQLVADMKALVPQAPPAFASAWGKALAAAFDPDLPNAMPAQVKAFNGSVLYGLLQQAEKQPLQNLDLAHDLELRGQRVDEAIRRFDALKGHIADPNPIAQEPLLEAASNATRSVIDALFELWVFHQKFALLNEGEQLHAKISEQFYKLQPDYWWRRSTVRIFGEPQTLQAQLNKFLARSVSGVVWVDNAAGNPVTITGSPAGRVIIAVGPGGANIHEVCPEEAPAGLVTVYAHSGPVTVSGKNRVSLVIGPPSGNESPSRLRIDSSAIVRGALVLDQVRSGTELNGTWQRELRQVSGDNAPDGTDRGVFENYFVTVSPRVAFRRVMRE